MFELVETANQAAVIKVIGVGGGGGNAVNHMLRAEIEGVEFICANTDAQALRASNARNLVQLGNSITHGLGAGADPEIGRQSALEDRDRVMDIPGRRGHDIHYSRHGWRHRNRGRADSRAGGKGNGHPDRGSGDQAVFI